MVASSTLAPLQILDLEDNADDAHLIRSTLEKSGLPIALTVVSTAEDSRAALARQHFDLVLSDSSVPGMSAVAAFHQAVTPNGPIPFICVTGAADRATSRALLAAGAADYVLKEQLDQLPGAVIRAIERSRVRPAAPRNAALVLAAAAQALSLARDIETVRAIVRRSARELTGADGATFVLRDGEFCHYVDEDAIAPLWKGKRFPLQTCISGWAMLNARPAAIEDIYADSRIPADAYRPTFVKSLVMVPIRSSAPIGAIGNYWATQHRAAPEEIELLQALANTTSVAMENIQVYHELEQRVHDRTLQLRAANDELESFSYSVSHDLRAPLRAIRGFTAIIQEKHTATLTAESTRLFGRVASEAARMTDLIEDLLRLAQVSRQPLQPGRVDLSETARRIWKNVAAADPARAIDFVVAPDLTGHADPGLLDAALSNLLSNAFKYTGRVTSPARVEFGVLRQADATLAFFVRDNGAGFDMAHATRLFTPFQRLHSQAEFSGTGVGLATVQRIIQRHGGRIWAEASPGQGATFYFTLPEQAA